MKEVKKESDSALGEVVESDSDSKIFLPVELLHPHKLRDSWGVELLPCIPSGKSGSVRRKISWTVDLRQNRYEAPMGRHICKKW